MTMMNQKNDKDFMNTVDELTEVFGDSTVKMTFRDVKEGMDIFFDLMMQAVELVNLIHKESVLKKHHRAYLHVHEELEKRADMVSGLLSSVVEHINGKDHFFEFEDFPFADANEAEKASPSVTIPKEQYDFMVDDLLTLSELVSMVSDVRAKDYRFIQQMAKLFPSYAEYEKNRLSLYREAEKEAEEIFNRWADNLIDEDVLDDLDDLDEDYGVDELDDDYEPDEYFSD